MSEREGVEGQLISRFGKGESELWFVIMTKAKVDTHMENRKFMSSTIANP
jgi:hypothetical protein